MDMAKLTQQSQAALQSAQDTALKLDHPEVDTIVGRMRLVGEQRESEGLPGLRRDQLFEQVLGGHAAPDDYDALPRHVDLYFASGPVMTEASAP